VAVYYWPLAVGAATLLNNILKELIIMIDKIIHYGLTELISDL
jgi:hypothetical protein